MIAPSSRTSTKRVLVREWESDRVQRMAAAKLEGELVRLKTESTPHPLQQSQRAGALVVNGILASAFVGGAGAELSIPVEHAPELVPLNETRRCISSWRWSPFVMREV